MEAPISASQGAMRSLPRKLDTLLSGPKHELRAEEKKKLRVLQADLQGLIDNYLIEPSEVVSPALTAHSWMKDVRDLSYDIDDFIYELAHVGGGGSRISVVQKPPRFKISLFPQKLRRRQWITDEISRFRTRVKEAIRLHKECLGTCKWRPSSSGQPPPSPCYRLVGVDSSIQQLCSLLANDGQPEHRVVSIVGTRGVGKTTLAREVYRKIGGQFQCMAFVRTSPKPGMKGLLTSLLSQVRRCRRLPEDDALDVHELVVNIRAHLQDRTYLIVIEDLWALSNWDLVNRALPKGNWCSRILTTTEADVIAQICCADNSKFIPAKKDNNSKYMPSRGKNNPMYMPSMKENNSKYIIKKEPLSEDESTELFSNRAFGKHAECPRDLKEVSNEIIRRSGGLPLGINILASLLAHHPASSIEQWNYIKNSLSSELTTHTSLEKINQVLGIGYDNLPHDLKACMLYLCLYEEDCIIWKDDLVKQWIAEGFISAVKGGDEEEVACSYFGELVNRGMIQPVDTNCSHEIISCRVHHMVLRFIRDKSMEENFCIPIDHSQTTIRLADKVRRLGLHLGNVEDATLPGPESMRLLNVRSVTFCGFHKCMPSIVEFRFLQVLNLKLSVDPDRMMSHNRTGSDDLSGNLSEPDGLCYNLSDVSELFRLRYFHLDACHMSVALPTQMQHLKYLLAWEIDAEITVVPSDIVHLPGLLYLRIPSEAHLPTGIGRMTSLRTLRVFDLSKNSTENVMSLGELTNLQDLCLTCSTLQPDNLERNLECLGSVIRKLSNLRCVTLLPAVSAHVNTQHDAGASSRSTSWHDFSIVPVLPALLQKLELSRRCCLFSSLPEWTKELTKLCTLKIALRKVSREDVVILRGLPSLNALSLFIWTTPAIRIIFDNDGFSVLKYFKFVCAAPCLGFLDGAMPSVQKLKLGFNANRMEQYNLNAIGFEHLTGLSEVSLKIGGTGADEGDRKSAQSVWTDAIGMHPSTPIINVQWVDWNFCGEDAKHIEPRKEIQDKTSKKQNVTAMEGSNLFFEKEAKPMASSSIDARNQVESSEHGIQEKKLEEDVKKQSDTRTYAAPEPTFNLQNTAKHADGITEKHKVDIRGYGEIYKFAAFPPGLTAGPGNTRATVLEKSTKEQYNMTNSNQRFGAMPDNISNVKPVDIQETASAVEETLIIGRAEDKNKTIATLIGSLTPEFTVLPIYGTGGIGKTTLAQLIFNDSHFAGYSRVWVYVSHNFDLNRIGNSIISQLSEVSHVAEMQMIHNHLRKLLAFKKILIVLDDVWEKNPYTLENLKTLLRLGVDSMVTIIVTTRDETIAREICHSVEPYKLEGLSNKMCWTVIKQKTAFKDRVDKKELKNIGKEIAAKCGGVALAAQSLGYTLNGKTSDEWQSVRDNNIWSVSSIEDPSSRKHEVLASLLLSYTQMPECLKLCFSYCAIFPKGHNLVKYDLIYQWIALGFTEPSTIFNSMQLCEKYFTQLLGMSFLQPSSNGRQDKDVKLFMMHHLVHDLATAILAKQVDNESYRYALLTDCSKPLQLSVTSPANIKALHFLDCGKLELRGDAFSIATTLNVLDLSECFIQELPDSIGQLKQLRYLSAPRIQDQMIPNCITQLSELNYLNLEGSFNISELPESIGDMGSLMHLDLSGCARILELPVSFSKMKNLMHLDLSGCARIRELPVSFSKMKNLMHLDLSGCARIRELPVSFSKMKNLMHLNLSDCPSLEMPDALGGLTELQYLNLSIQPTIDVKHRTVLPKDMSNLIKLRYLNLSGFLKVMGPYQIYNLVGSISTLSNLEQLDLSENKELTRIPESIGNLRKLHTLNLSGCFKLKNLPDSLKVLKMKSLLLPVQ